MRDSLINASPAAPTLNTTEIAIAERGSLVYGASNILNRALVNLGILNDSDSLLIKAIRTGDKSLIKYILKEDYYTHHPLSQSQMTRLREAFRLAVELTDSGTVKWLFKCGFVLNKEDCMFAKKIPNATILAYVARAQNRPLDLILDKTLLSSMGVDEFTKLIKKVIRFLNEVEPYNIFYYKRQECIFLFALNADIADDQKPTFLQDILNEIGPRNGRFLDSIVDHSLWSNEKIAEVILRNIQIDEREEDHRALRFVLEDASKYYKDHPPKSNIMQLIDATINLLNERTCSVDTPSSSYFLGFFEGRFRKLNPLPLTTEQQVQVNNVDDEILDRDDSIQLSW